MFEDRHDAAEQLAKKLEPYKKENGVVLAVPRGGVPIGYAIAERLGFPLEVILSKKIGHPYNPEYAIGSVTLEGAVVDNNVLDVDMSYIRQEAERLFKELKAKAKQYMGNRKPTDLRNKTVIVVDDGIATGSTLLATVRTIRKSNPAKIIVAVPVAPLSAAEKFRNEADEFICLLTPQIFYGVGQFYADFTPVSDEEVARLLRDAYDKRKAA